MSLQIKYSVFITYKLPSSGVTLISGVTLLTWGDFDLYQETTSNCKIRCRYKVTLYFELYVVAWSRDYVALSRDYFAWSHDYYFYRQNFMWHQFWLLECGGSPLPRKCRLIPRE